MEVVLMATMILIILSLVFYFKKTPAKKPDQQSNQTQTKQTKQCQERVIQVEEAVKVSKKKKKKSQAKETVATKTAKELQQIYSENYYGTISLRNHKNISTVTAIAIKHSKILFATSRHELVLYDLKKWKPHTPCQDLFFTSLDNNQATAVTLTPQHYYAALDFQKTIVCYSFKGGEGGVYFQQVRKFKRNIFRSNQSTMHVPEHEQYIITTGQQSDTTISIWSPQGDKIHSLSTYQIEHYDIKYAANLILVRGWTSQVKTFQILTQKDGSFSKIDKSYHLTLNEKPQCSIIDNLGLYALTISGDHQIIKLWTFKQEHHHLTQTTIDSYQIDLEQPKYGAITTLRMDNQRLRTLIVLANDHKLALLSRQLKPIKVFQGVSIESILSFGTTKSAVLATISNGKLSVWDFTKIAQSEEEYVHP